jgi:hypothetical protein
MYRTVRNLIWAASAVCLVALAPGIVTVALGVLLAISLLVVLGAWLVRRAALRVFAQEPHLRRLGEDFERHFDGAAVTAVDRDLEGRVLLHLAWDDQQTVHLDADGMPDSMDLAGPGSATWVLPAAELGPFELGTLQELPEAGITIVERGTVVLAGEAVSHRRLTATNGLELRVECAVPAL